MAVSYAAAAFHKGQMYVLGGKDELGKKTKKVQVSTGTSYQVGSEKDRRRTPGHKCNAFMPDPIQINCDCQRRCLHNSKSSFANRLSSPRLMND